jgi:hypothetical protein
VLAVATVEIRVAEQDDRVHLVPLRRAQVPLENVGCDLRSLAVTGEHDRALAGAGLDRLVRFRRQQLGAGDSRIMEGAKAEPGQLRERTGAVHELGHVLPRPREDADRRVRVRPHADVRDPCAQLSDKGDLGLADPLVLRDLVAGAAACEHDHGRAARLASKRACGSTAIDERERARGEQRDERRARERKPDRSSARTSAGRQGLPH